MSEITYEYAEGGVTPSGREIPDIPVMWLRIRTVQKTATAPALIDTGFDGGIYSDDRLPEVFGGDSPNGTADLVQAAGTIKCEIFRPKVEVVEEGGDGNSIDLGDIPVYIPVRVGELAENIIVGRKVLNRLNLSLKNGGRIEVRKARNREQV